MNLEQERTLPIFVYRMGRLCGGAHEISGIKAPLFLCSGVGGGCGVEVMVVVWAGFGVHGVLLRDVVGGGERMGGGMGDVDEEGGLWCQWWGGDGWGWWWCWVVEWVVVGWMMVVGLVGDRVGWVAKLVVVLMVGAGLGSVLVGAGVGGV